MSQPSPYTTILEFFDKHASIPFEVSYVPASDILTSGPNIGIPKACLVAAFTHAHNIFTHSAPAASDAGSKTLLNAALILILTGSEHQTAVNMRRRALRASRLAPETELNWVQSLLTSPLPKHNKSPLLWAYRRWIFMEFPALQPTADAEMAVVQKSAEAHSRNYYAWDHARWVLRTLGNEGAAETILDAHLKFCWLHPSDCGVWAFLGAAMERCEDDERKERIVEEVMGFSTIAPGHESLWGFVRAVVGRGEGGLGMDARTRLRGALEKTEAQGTQGHGQEMRLQARSLKWIERFGDLRENMS